MPSLTTRAPAKINLTLRVVGRRGDGYHLLDSLVAFAGTGDTVSLEPAGRLSLRATGPFAAQAGDTSDNLVLKAANLLCGRLPSLRLGHFHLVKRLPVASGIGGGSSDAAAALRLLARHNGLALDHPAVIAAARATGADVPVCLEARARQMRGIGDELGPVLKIPRLFAVLVNPGVHVATPMVFKALGLDIGARRPTPETGGDIGADIASGTNDLEAPAIVCAPVIAEVLASLRADPACRFARMSGSGATCYGVFDDCADSAAAARVIRRAHPGWWVKATVIR
jgi:4-diphosphocytidyl-2-C-methyl-D-erythritol kinase